MNYIKQAIKDLKPYSIESKRSDIMLDANENPYSLPEDIIDDIKKSIDFMSLNRYPEPRAEKLCMKLSEYVMQGTNKDMIITGDGSDELIGIVIDTFVAKGGKVLLPVPCFTMYNVYSSIKEGQVITFQSNSDFTIDIDGFIEKCKNEKPELIILCNPNNPTGTVMKKDDIIKIVQNSDCIVVVDEAYAEFLDSSAIDMIPKYDNLIVLKTLSKAWGLAGIRLGYLIANENIIDELLKVKPPYNVNSITQEIACKILDYKEHMKSNVKKILNNRDKLINELKKIKDIEIFETGANFFLIRVPNADMVYKELLKSGIAVRCFGNANGLNNCIRITTGKKSENELLIKKIKSIIK